MAYIVYILMSQKDHGLYVGCTTNLPQRLAAHNKGNVSSTKNRKPFVAIHSENFGVKGQAFQRERFLKSLWSARFKRKIKKEFLEKYKG